jgi:PIN domain nuclease of toxin-antitoxin system
VSLLLDTQVVLWMLLGERERFPAPVIDALIERDATISAVSFWEIAIKRSIGRLRLDRDDWVDVLSGMDFRFLPIGVRHAAAVEALPRHHRDPFDRMLIVQAQAEELTLVTADETLAAYGVPILW